MTISTQNARNLYGWSQKAGFKPLKSDHLYMKSRFLVQMVACVICQRINLPSKSQMTEDISVTR